MSEFDKEKAEEWLKENWTGSKNCQICQSQDWLLLDNVWELRRFERGGLVVGSGPLLPVVALMCNVCGQMLFFNAIAVRAIERRDEEGGDHE